MYMHAAYRKVKRKECTGERERGKLREIHPPTNDGMQNGSSVGTCTYHKLLARLAPTCMLMALINNIFASELSQKFIKDLLLVGHQSFFGHEQLSFFYGV